MTSVRVLRRKKEEKTPQMEVDDKTTEPAGVQFLQDDFF